MGITEVNLNYHQLCCFAESDPRLIKFLQSEEDFFNRRLLLANIPKKYWQYEWDKIKDDLNLDPDNQNYTQIVDEYLANIENKFKEGRGLYIAGAHGTSKTTTAILVAMQAMKEEFTGFYLHSTDIMNYVANGWKDDIKKEYWEYITEETNFLVIDDIARNFVVSEKERQILDRLFVYRTNNCLPILLTTNLTTTEIKDIFGESVISLFKESVDEISFVGEDVRQRFQRGQQCKTKN